MEHAISPHLDLKRSLTLRVVAVALFCFLIAAAVALFGTYRDVRQVNRNVADILVRELQVQLFRIQSNIDVSAHFPDWDPVAEGLQSAGQCMQYVGSNGRLERSSCIGLNPNAASPPDWFATLFEWLPPAQVGVVRQDVIAIFSNRDVEGPIYEILDDERNTVAKLGLNDFKALFEAQKA